MERVIATIIGVVVAVGASAVLFVGANRWFDQARRSWRGFGAITGALLGLAITLVLVGNRLVAWRPNPDTDLTWWLVPLGLVAGGAYGWVMTGLHSRVTRLVVGGLGGALLGAVAGIFARREIFPAMQILHLVLWPVIGAAVFAAVTYLRKTDLLKGAVTGATLGWLVGAFLAPGLGGGTRAEVMMGMALLGLGIGVRIGLGDPLTYEEREALFARSRAVVFLAPALGFIAVTLVIPAIRTIYLSFLNARAEEFVGFENYVRVFTDPGAVNFSRAGQIFSSSLLWWALVAIGLGLLLGVRSGRQRGQGFEANGGSVGPIAIGVVLLVFAIFANLRGTVFNNLWWVFTVTLAATALGLAIAVLADRSGMESVAKSIIFMPMAISFVGAGIIWRFMYIARPVQNPQTGTLNAIWVGLGRLSVSETPRLIALALLGLLVLGLLYLAYRGFKADSNGLVLGSLVTAAPLLWIMYRLFDRRLGGVGEGPGGDPVAQTIIFLQEPPFNNVWLMVVLIWIQTGFTMVIFSAAIKAVPADLIEASKVDGASESQTFWRVTVPQIAPTIGVVVTTLIVVVMKVFDIVKVMTNGNFDTQVIANLMWTRAFSEFNLGLGSTLAVVLFLSVLPVMVINIRRMQKEAA